ncbi:MAG TPA: hypothetical protein VMT18_06340 [Planctomycetota bacterium]|nr:hypothetical protein [Planctomycetota bacterium]
MQGKRRARAGRLGTLDALTLGAVALVVLLVSLPRLQDLAVRENEGDARWLSERLAELSGEVPGAARDIRGLLERQPNLTRLLDDAEYLENGRLLRRHGYLFELVARGEDAGECAVAGVRAWPWRYERTGRRAYLWRCGEPVRAHANDGGRWSGPERPPDLASGDAGWQALAR